MKTESLLHVTGMTCGSCVHHVEGALRKLDGVTAAEVRLREGEVLVLYDAAAVTLPGLIAAIEDEGYGAKSAG